MTEVVLPNGRIIEDVPEGATKQQIKQFAIQNNLANELDFREISKARQFFQKVGQGLTFGFMDEMAAATVGLTAELTGIGSFEDAYQSSLEQIRLDEAAYAQQNPVASAVGEVIGGIATGGATGARLLSNQAMKTATPIGRVGRVAGVGSGEGALYGAGSAQEGDRLEGAAQGAAIGAVAAPVGAKAIEKILEGGQAVAGFAARKMSDTPRREAERAIRAMAEAEGIDADDAIRMLDDLGDEATLADLGENFRSLARAATDNAGSFRNTARQTMNQRQLGQQGRLLEAAQVAAGKQAGDFRASRSALISGRRERAAPLYTQAFNNGLRETPTLTQILNRPAMKSAMRQADRLAADEGQFNGALNLMQRVHYAKMSLDDKIGAAVRSGNTQRARILQGMKRELLDEIEEQNPEYIQAMDIFSSDSRMIDAMDKGINLFKTNADDLAETVNNMTASEKDMFRLGAVRSIKDQLDNTNMNSDATRALIGKQGTRDKLALVFDDPESFIQQAAREQEFTRTRNVLTGGSPTAERLIGQKNLSEMIQPELLTTLASGDPATAMAGLIRILSRHKVTPELMQELADEMLAKGQTPENIRRIFGSSQIIERLGDEYIQAARPVIAGSLAVPTQKVTDLNSVRYKYDSSSGSLERVGNAN